MPCGYDAGRTRKMRQDGRLNESVLASEVGVAAVPGSSFFHEDVHHLIRFHFAKEDATLNEALNRLEDLRDKAKGQVLWK